MFKKNTAVTGFGIGNFINTTTGATVTTGTPTCKRTIDGTAGACANAAAYDADGLEWKINLAAGDLNGNMIALSFTLTDCFPINYTIKTVTGIPDASGYMPSDVIAVSGDTTAADNLEKACDGTTYNIGGGAVVAASVTTKTGYELAAGQKVDVDTIKTQAVTCAGSVTVLASVGTAATSTAQTGDSYAIVNNGTYGNSKIATDVAAVLVDTNELQTDWANGGRLDLLIDGITGYVDCLPATWVIPLAASSYPTNFSILSIAALTGYVTYANAAPPTAAAIADAVWDELITGHDGDGKAGAQLWTNIDGIFEDTVTLVGRDAPLTAAQTRTAIGLSEANLDTILTQLSVDVSNVPTVTEFNARTLVSASYATAAQMAVVYAWSAGNVRDKSGSEGTYEVLSPADGSTVVMTITPAETTPYKTVVIA